MSDLAKTSAAPPPETAGATTAGTRAARVIAECRLLATMSEEPDRTTRRFLTPPVAAVHAHLRQRMHALGMTVSVDAVGNLRGLWQPLGLPAAHKRLLTGSHIDTVPGAGAFDGVLGVVLALELVAAAQAAKLSLPIEIIAFSEEEGVRFGVPFLGSRAVAGRFDPALLDLLDAEGISIAEAIRHFGLDPSAIDAAQADQAVLGFLELHIEQGPVLEAESLSIAVVTAIAGQTRCEVSFLGQSNHAGTTPMRLRRDALVAAAEWITAVESVARSAQTRPESEGLVATVGKLTADPNAGNVIAGSVRASLDVRHPLDRVREEAVGELLKSAQAIATKRGLACETKLLMQQKAIPMDEEWTAHLAECVQTAGFPLRLIASGAGHDAMVMATRMPTAMLFLRSPGGISHDPAEAVLEQDVEAILLAATLFLHRLDQKIGIEV